MSRDLRKKDPVEIEISYTKLFIGIILFAFVFWVIGTIFRYYVYVGGSV